VNGGGHDSCRTGKRRRCCTHQPTANEERERGSLSVSRFNGEEGNRKKRWVFRKPSDLFHAFYTILTSIDFLGCNTSNFFNSVLTKKNFKYTIVF
jgi:hypothetical protein